MNDDSRAVDADGQVEPLPSPPLRRAVLEVEAHVGSAGWDQPPRLYALVRTADLVAAEPSLADQLAVSLRDDPDGYTTIEQEDLPADQPLEEVLDDLEWPDAVHGCVVALERIMLPPEAEADLPDNPVELVQAVAEHPQRREVRLVAAVSREGDRHCAVRSRPRLVDEPVSGDAHAGEQVESELLEGPDLVPGLTDALRRTLEPTA